MPDPAGLELIAHELRERHSDSIADTLHYRGIATLVVEPARVVEVLGWLRDDSAQQYRFLASLHACDYLPQEPRFGVHYELLNMERVERIHVKVLLADPGEPELPEIDSCVSVFPTAEFHEREAFDMFGIRFDGHPNLTRIIMDDDWEGHPLRKDYPLGGEPVRFSGEE
jgi:NADH-quinone oxidoreductase subunit C